METIHASKDTAPLPDSTNEFYFSSPQTNEGLQTEPFFMISIDILSFTTPIARTVAWWIFLTFLKTFVPEYLVWVWSEAIRELPTAFRGDRGRQLGQLCHRGPYLIQGRFSLCGGLI